MSSHTRAEAHAGKRGGGLDLRARHAGARFRSLGDARRHAVRRLGEGPGAPNVGEANMRRWCSSPFSSLGNMRLVAVSAMTCAIAGAAGPTADMQSAALPGTAAMGTEAEYQRWKVELSNWGRWGKDDELGALNLITPAKRRAVATLVREGVLLRWGRWARRQALGPWPDQASAGLDLSVIPWLKRRDVAVIGWETPSYSPQPPGQPPGASVHVRLDHPRNHLARSCRFRGAEPGRRVAQPVGVHDDDRAAADSQGTGSPVNPIAVF